MLMKTFYQTTARAFFKSHLLYQFGCKMSSQVFSPLCVHASPTHLHNSALCSCRSAVASTCPSLDCRTPRRPSCSCHRLLPPRTVSCSRHTHLKTQNGTKVKCTPLSENVSTARMSGGRTGVRVTCVAATHVHVSYLSPAVRGRIVNFTALPH